MRTLIAALVGLAICFGAARADDEPKKKGDKPAGKNQIKKVTEATITEVNAKEHTLQVRIKGKSGREEERTFKLAETVRYFDSTGKAVAVDVFKSGDYVLVVEAAGQVTEVRQGKKKRDGDRPYKKKKDDDQ